MNFSFRPNKLNCPSQTQPETDQRTRGQFRPPSSVDCPADAGCFSTLRVSLLVNGSQGEAGFHGHSNNGGARSKPTLLLSFGANWILVIFLTSHSSAVKNQSPLSETVLLTTQ